MAVHVMKHLVTGLGLSVLIAGCGGQSTSPPPADTGAPAAEAPAPPADPAPAEADPATPTTEPASPEEPTPPPAAAAPAAVPAGGPDTSITSSRGNAEAGAAVYKQLCIPCHQADGTGLNGMLAGNFVAEKERLLKSDAELLEIIAKGRTGPGGRLMPPQESLLNEQQRIDVLTYIRQTFGQ